MALGLGAILRGGKYDFRLIEQLGDKTVFNSVFKAEVLLGSQSICPKRQWAVVKTADVNNRVQRECLLREYNNYRRPSIASSKNFRKIYDTVNDQTSWTAQKPFCLALEWMDTTLADIPSESHIQSPVLVASILKTVLGGFGELEREHLIYSDLKPSNILISGVNGPSPEVKIGDLGLMGDEGGNLRWVQPNAFRAPEVWTGVRCYHKSDVWSAAALVLKWLDTDLLGDHDLMKPFHPMSWCLAKVMRLFDPNGSMAPPLRTVDGYYQQCFDWAKQLVLAPSSDDPKELMLLTPPYEMWAECALDGGVPKVVLDIIRLMAVVDLTKRPSALQALASPEYNALRDAAATYRH